MNRLKLSFSITSALLAVLVCSAAPAEVKHRQINASNLLVDVSGESWQPEGFENGTAVPASYVPTANIKIDGIADEAEWNQAVEIEVPLSYGNVQKTSLKALYTDKKVYIRVRWADDNEDRDHRPWVWSPEQNKYVEGSQVEDSLLLSFEAGCDWNPSLLAGYIYDFDGWHWMAARSDPLGQAVDVNGHLQDQNFKDPDFIKYLSRQKEDTWNMKYAENKDVKLHSKWDEIDRVYSLQPFTEELYFKARPDETGRDKPEFAEKIAVPVKPIDGQQIIAQFKPLKLKDGAGEVSAKGHWENGYWTVEFSRILETPARHNNDTIFQRITQFSVHAFNRTDRIDEASESKRLFLQFMPEEPQLAKD